MKIFLSSTILDLKDLRDALVTWLTEDGHQIIASEKGTLPIEPGRHSYEQCLKAAAECDCLVAVIDGRFGGEYPTKGSNQSITEAEIEVAITQGKKTLVFVRQSVWDALATQNAAIRSGEVKDHWTVNNIIEDVQIFGLIDRLRRRPKDNWIFMFNSPTDLIATIRTQIDSSQSMINWLTECQKLLSDHKDRLSSNPLQDVKPKSFSDYVPLGLVKREQKERPRIDRDLDPSADRGSELYQIETTPIEHNDFLKTVIDRQPGEHIVILGEPGAGKTTLLTRVWQSLLDNANPESPVIVAWIPLAALGSQSLQKYVEESWLAQIYEDQQAALSSFTSLRQAGRVCLLLDDADEIGGDGLQKIAEYLRLPWAKLLKVVVTCRLNLWDGSGQNELKQNFQIFRTLGFKYANSAGEDEVAAFIGKCFDDVEEGKKLRSALDEVGKERIKDLAKNPLRLTLLCNIWQREQGLPDTQAGLYQRFVHYVYAWSKIPDVREMQLELDRVMGILAKYGINKPSLRFRFTTRELQEQVPDLAQRKLLKALGWLNCVGVDESGQEVYAFFHPTFQEYFAACSIDDWDYFLPRAHVDRPVPYLDD
jgi:GTPase SAR1 family protein